LNPSAPFERGQTSFVPVMLHEMFHAFGFGGFRQQSNGALASSRANTDARTASGCLWIV
jgi:hypothetical protein